MTSPLRLALACPHCHLDLPAAWSRERAGRCPTCLLLIGAGRCVPAPGNADLREHCGSAAGALASAARRTDTERGNSEAILAAIQAAADEIGRSVALLRMVEYQRISQRDASIPDLAVVLATFSTWKHARTEAAARRSRHAEGAPPASSSSVAAERRLA